MTDVGVANSTGTTAKVATGGWNSAGRMQLTTSSCGRLQSPWAEIEEVACWSAWAAKAWAMAGWPYSGRVLESSAHATTLAVATSSQRRTSKPAPARRSEEPILIIEFEEQQEHHREESLKIR